MSSAAPTVPAVLPRNFAERYRRIMRRSEEAKAEADDLVVEARKTASLAEVAQALGISRSMVVKIEARARKRASE